MTQENNYLKVIKALKKNSPVLDDKDELTDNVIRKIREIPEKPAFQEKLHNLLFGWVENFGLRLGMATITLFLVGFFIVQQLFIQDRLNSLEKQLVKTVNTINGQKSEPGMMQKVILKRALLQQPQKDSITVSINDMNELMNNYMELLDRYEKIKRRVGPEPNLTQ